jgi:cyclophilin family peptidyl-prolyl cis-trans isomerase
MTLAYLLTQVFGEVTLGADVVRKIEATKKGPGIPMVSKLIQATDQWKMS